MKNKKLANIPVMLTIALIATGLTYAHWQQTLYIEGKVETGELSVGFEPPLIISDNEDWLPEPKDVGTVTASLIDLDGDGVYDKIEITIDNAYPRYEAYVSCKIRNYGTIPVIIQDIIVIYPPEIYVEVDWWIYEGMQIDPDNEVLVEVYVHVEQWAYQGSTYTFTGTIDFIQWNKYTP